MRSQNIKYLVGVDHLRAYAALLVVIYHVVPKGMHTHNPLKALVVQGNAGVALFMVLSGFIFTVGLLGKDIDFKGFLKNRIVRIYPLYLFTLLAAMSAFPLALDFGKFALSLLPFINQPTAFHTNIIPTEGFRSALDPFTMSWTIGLELQFYLLFPFLLALINNKRMKQLLYFWAAFALLRVMLMQLPGTIENFITYYTMFGRFDQFVLGILAGYAFKNRRKLIDRFSAHMLAGSVIIFVIMSMLVENLSGDLSKMMGWWSIVLPPVYGLVFAILVVSYVAAIEKLRRWLKLSDLIAKVGELSYSIYLMHVLVIITAMRLFPHLRGHFGVTWYGALAYALLIIVPLTLAVSFITYNGIEKPFLEMRKKYTKPKIPLKVAEQEL